MPFEFPFTKRYEDFVILARRRYNRLVNALKKKTGSVFAKKKTLVRELRDKNSKGKNENPNDPAFFKKFFILNIENKGNFVFTSSNVVIADKGIDTTELGSHSALNEDSLKMLEALQKMNDNGLDAKQKIKRKNISIAGVLFSLVALIVSLMM